MNPAPYTEDILVQQTTADYLEQQLGWESIYAHNVEDFGPNSLLGRASDREVVLTRHLHTALRSLNPGLPDAAYDAAVQQITATAVLQTLVAANRDQYDLMRDGVPATFHNDKGERVRQRLKVFDFETPTNNDFLCVRELWVRGDLYRRRADIVDFVMVMFTRKVHRKLGGNFTFLVLTDRDDLDSQIYKTFAGCGVVNHDHDPCRASDGRHLSRLLAEHKAYVFSLIQKFNANPSAAYTDRDDIIVVSDEAHRTQYGTLASNMRNALPNASYSRLIKEGMELPTSMRDKPSFRNKQRMDLDDAFKEPEHPFRIAIVCAMWLTGFDVPCLSTLYLDKSLKAHTLMQAIARANRVNEGKNNGLIVDYCGILKHLRQALATFAGAEPGGEGHAIDPAKPEEDLLASLAEAIALVRDFLAKGGAPLDDVMGKTGFERNAAIVSAKEVVNENDETRQRFEGMCHEVFRIWSDATGLPTGDYSEAEVKTKTDDLFRHVFRAYPTVSSPYYENAA